MEEHKKFSIIEPELIKKLMSLSKEEGMKLISQINYKLHLQKESILNQAFKENRMTKEEYEKEYKEMFYDDFGNDSFTQYLNAAMNTKIDYFITENERMLNKRKALEKRFGLRIASPKDVMGEVERSKDNQ